MPAKASGPGRFEAIDAFDGGVGWIAHPEETMQRASHALRENGEVWLVDPVDAEGLDERLDDLGDVAGVVVLFNYHRRDAAAVATRHGVPVYLPSGMTALSEDDLAAPIERVDGRLPGTGYHLREVTRTRFWQEWSLFDGETLLVAESVGAADYFLAPGERLGVAPLWRLFPPTSAFEGLEPDRVLCGHGEGVFADASGELRRAMATTRGTAPRMYLRHGTTLIRNALSATLR